MSDAGKEQRPADSTEPVQCRRASSDADWKKHPYRINRDGILTKSQLVDAIETAIITKRQMAEDGQDVEVSLSRPGC
jgi:hypothetical protein